MQHFGQSHAYTFMHLPCNMNLEMVSQQINFIKEGGGISNSNRVLREGGEGLIGGMQVR